MIILKNSIMMVINMTLQVDPQRIRDFGIEDIDDRRNNR